MSAAVRAAWLDSPGGSQHLARLVIPVAHQQTATTAIEVLDKLPAHPLVLGNVLESRIELCPADVVHYAIDAPVCRQGDFDDVSRRCWVDQIGLDGNESGVGLMRSLLLNVGADDDRTFVKQLCGGGGADAVCCSGDDDHLVVQLQIQFRGSHV
jgi:hypothetical protein